MNKLFNLVHWNCFSKSRPAQQMWASEAVIPHSKEAWMVNTPSTMIPLGTQAPSFNLPDTGGKVVSLDDYKDAPALLVVFLCNHCPFVKHVLPHFVELAGGISAARRWNCRNQLQ